MTITRPTAAVVNYAPYPAVSVTATISCSAGDLVVVFSSNRILVGHSQRP